MHSYRFLTGVVLSILLGGTVSVVDLALAGQRSDQAVANAAGPSRLVAPALSESTLNSVANQPDGQGFNFGGQFGGGFQGGGFNFGSQFGGGFQFGGGTNSGGGGFQFGGFNNGGGILTPFGWVPIRRVSAQALPVPGQAPTILVLPPPPPPPLILPPLLPPVPPWPLVAPDGQAPSCHRVSAADRQHTRCVP